MRSRGKGGVLKGCHEAVGLFMRGGEEEFLMGRKERAVRSNAFSSLF